MVDFCWGIDVGKYTIVPWMENPYCVRMLINQPSEFNISMFVCQRGSLNKYKYRTNNKETTLSLLTLCETKNKLQYIYIYRSLCKYFIQLCYNLVGGFNPVEK